MNPGSTLHNLFFVKELVVISILNIIIGIRYTYKKALYIGIVTLSFLFFFFRNSLTVFQDHNSFLSPSSSTITNIENGDDYNTVYTYLSPFDKHFMIAPVDCEIIDIQYKPILPTDSERLRVVFKDTYQRIFSLDQIVSKLGMGAWLLKFIYPSRCLVFYEVGTKLKQGQRYGLIRFGSNMQYTLPKHYNVIHEKNSHVAIGTPIATLKSVKSNHKEQLHSF